MTPNPIYFQPRLTETDGKQPIPQIIPKTHFGKDVAQKRNHDACGIAGYLNIDRKPESGSQIKKMMISIIDRENGLGGGYAAYGVFPDLADSYAIQILTDTSAINDQVAEFLNQNVIIEKDEEIPTDRTVGVNPPYPVAWRYFVSPPKTIPVEKHDDYIVDIVMHINANIPNAFCLSSGKNMAVFKGNGWAYEIADYFKIQDYKASLWIGHSRFPTNTPGSWFGAHPFNILDWSVAHNGEITSYGTNKRYLEMYGYKCTLLTDTEVIAYLFDLLVRRHENPVSIATLALAPPYYDSINTFTGENQRIAKIIRMTYRSAFLNGPFSILVGRNQPQPTLIGLTDRKKLRPMIAGISDDESTVLISSEEAAIRTYRKSVGKIWAPHAGNPIIVEADNGIIRYGVEPRLSSTRSSTESGTLKEVA